MGTISIEILYLLSTRETSLKLRKGLDITAKYRTVESISNLRGSLECEPPNERLYQFKGRLILYQDNTKAVYPLHHTQLLHRVR
jgi:phospholipid-transporting ATPase